MPSIKWHGRFAQQAQLEIAYAYYKDNEPAQAVTAAERFIKLHPNHPSVDYAYYLKGLANFNGDLGWLGYLSGQDLTERDPKTTREAFDAFKDLATRFPDSKYTPDAIARMNYLVNALASHEVHSRVYSKPARTSLPRIVPDYAQPIAALRTKRAGLARQAYDSLHEDLRAEAERVLMKIFPTALHKGDPRRAAWCGRLNGIRARASAERRN